MQKLFSLIFVVCATLFATPAPSKDKPIVIAAIPTRSEWVAQVGKQLSDAIRYPSAMFGTAPEGGLVSVAFVADPNGMPTNLKLVRSSRHSAFDRTALVGVARIKTLYPKPLDVKEGQRIRANILFATSYDDYEQQLKALRREAAKSHTRSALDRNTIVLSVPAKPRGGIDALAR